MKVTSGIICILLAVSVKYPGYVNTADVETGQIVYPQKVEVRQLDNTTKGTITANDGQIDDHERLLDNGAKLVPSKSQDVLDRKKKRIGRLLKLIGKGVTKYIRGSALRRLNRLRPRGKALVSRSGSRVTFQYTKRGGYTQALRDFRNLKPSDLNSYKNGDTIVGRVGDYIVNVRKTSKGRIPTLEYYKAGQRTEVTKIRYIN